MNLQGQITNIVPDGGYQSQNGYINTFQMTIQAPNGVFTGQIGSKSQVYPLAVGEQINVTATATEHGVRFKKFDPKYANQPPAQTQPSRLHQQPAQTTTAPPQNAPQSTNSGGRDYDAEEKRRYRGMSASYVKDLVVAGKIEMKDYDDCALHIVNFIYEKPSATVGGYPVTNDNYNDGPLPSDDDLPF